MSAWLVTGCLVSAGLCAACHSPAEQALREGNAASAAGRYAEARTAYLRAVSAQPESPRAHALLGTAAYVLGERAQAEAEWARAVALGRSDDASLGLALLALDRHDVAACLAALPATPSDQARLLKARALLERGAAGDGEAALAAVEPMTLPEAIFFKGGGLLRLKQYAAAQTAFSSLAATEPVLANYGLARLAAAQGRPADVLVYLAAARAAAKGAWRSDLVVADPAFEFLRDHDEFRVLTRP